MPMIGTLIVIKVVVLIRWEAATLTTEASSIVPVIMVFVREVRRLIIFF
jgi:hypothetical protein